MATKTVKDRVADTAQLFMDAWLKGDTKTMYRYCQKTWKATNDKDYFDKFLHGNFFYEISSIEQKGETMYDVWVTKIFHSQRIRKIRLRVIAERKPFKPSLKGKFGVNPISIK